MEVLMVLRKQVWESYFIEENGRAASFCLNVFSLKTSKDHPLVGCSQGWWEESQQHCRGGSSLFTAVPSQMPDLLCGQQISWHFPVSFLHSPSEGFSLDKFLKNLILSWHPVFICPEQTHHLEAKTVSQFLQIYGVYGKSVLGSKAFWP